MNSVLLLISLYYPSVKNRPYFGSGWVRVHSYIVMSFPIVFPFTSYLPRFEGVWTRPDLNYDLLGIWHNYFTWKKTALFIYDSTDGSLAAFWTESIYLEIISIERTVGTWSSNETRITDAYIHYVCTVKPLYKDHTWGPTTVAIVDRWSLIKGSFM